MTPVSPAGIFHATHKNEVWGSLTALPNLISIRFGKRFLLNASFYIVKKGCLIDGEIAGRVHDKSSTVLGQPILAGNQFACVGMAIAIDPQIDVALMAVGPILIAGHALIFHDEVFL